MEDAAIWRHTKILPWKKKVHPSEWRASRSLQRKWRNYFTMPSDGCLAALNVMTAIVQRQERRNYARATVFDDPVAPPIDEMELDAAGQ